MKEKSEDPMIHMLKNAVLPLDPRIAGLEFYVSDESYCEDKKRIYLCIRDEKDRYYDFNTLIYIVNHELAHALTNDIDPQHVGKEFKEKFADLLLQSEKLGIYDPKIPMVKTYCNIRM